MTTQRRLAKDFGSVLVPYWFVVPALAYLSLFMFLPLAHEIGMSRTDAKLTNPGGGHFIGLRNYRSLFVDADFYTTLRVTVVYTLSTVVISVALGIVSALVVNRAFRGRGIARAILLLGWAIPSTAAALIWSWMYNEHSGVLNRIVVDFGGAPIPWLRSPHVALAAVVATTVWQATPFVMLVILAALQSVPEEVCEAATIDGADRLNAFRAVTWPHIWPSVRVVGLLIAVWSIRRYDIIYLLTGGGPIDSTATLVVQLRQIAFQGYDLGEASAYGVIGLILALLVASFHYLGERAHTAKGARR